MFRWPPSKLDRVLANQATIISLLQTLVKQDASIMALQDDLVAAVTAETNAATAAKAALAGLQAQVADLQAKANSGVDPAVIAKAIADLGASATDLSSAIPANTPATPAAGA